jgi:hypothetical protein
LIAIVFLAFGLRGHAGPIQFLGPPAVSTIDINGGTFLPASPPNLPVLGNPPLAAAAPLSALRPFGFLEGIRVTGANGFMAGGGGTASIRYIALRPFQVGSSEEDLLGVAYDVGYWSNLQGSEAIRVRYRAETCVPGIGLAGVGDTVPAAIPFNAQMAHPPRQVSTNSFNSVFRNGICGPRAG